jgi:hypothetical protein
MKSKLLFFITITFLVGIKWSYDYLYSANSYETKVVTFQNNNSSYDSVQEWKIYKNKMLQHVLDNKVRIINLKSAIKVENKVVIDKLEKQIECIEFKNNQLEISLNNFKLESIAQFQYYKLNLNLQLEENNQLITDIFLKHLAILTSK